VRAEVLILWQRGLVPLAIADPKSVTRILHAEGFEIPSYLTTTGQKDRRRRCEHCRQKIT
jgi:hypothetical protein